jgi:SAM-dependent methyltransferase
MFRKFMLRLGTRRKPDFGDFARLDPFSTQFGYDRGGPIDRVFIEKFLEENKRYIKGRVLEIGDNEYTKKYGKDHVTQSDILHVNAKNPIATIIGDLSDLMIEDNVFDCIILTQTLHLIYDFREALHNSRRILKPGGTLLITVPGIVNIDHAEWGTSSYYTFTSHFMNKMAADVFSGDETDVQHYGNVFLAAAFLNGIGAPEIEQKYFEHHDLHYQILISARITKASS